MNDVAPPGAPDPPQPPPKPATGNGSGGSNKVLLIVGAVTLAVLLAGGGYVLGKSKGEDDIKAQYEVGQPKYSAIYEAGQQAGQALGRQQGQQTGEAAGKAEGTKAGLEKGEAQGVAAGNVEGANTVFDNYSSWEVGGYYVVQIGQGQDGVNYTLASRRQIVDGESYRLCVNDPQSVCVLTP